MLWNDFNGDVKSFMRRLWLNLNLWRGTNRQVSLDAYQYVKPFLYSLSPMVKLLSRRKMACSFHTLDNLTQLQMKILLGVVFDDP